MSWQITTKRIEQSLTPAIGEARTQLYTQQQLQYKNKFSIHTFSIEKSKFVKTNFMAASPSGNELNKYWVLLTAAQKESLLDVIKSFLPSTDVMDQQVQEPDALYNKEGIELPLVLLQQLTWEQKEALISLIESFGIEIPGQRISIEQYNKEIDEAMARMDAGESYTHEQVIEMSKTWVNGK